MLLRGFGTREHDYLFKSKREYVLISFEGTVQVMSLPYQQERGEMF